MDWPRTTPYVDPDLVLLQIIAIRSKHDKGECRWWLPEHTQWPSDVHVKTYRHGGKDFVWCLSYVIPGSPCACLEYIGAIMTPAIAAMILTGDRDGSLGRGF